MKSGKKGGQNSDKMSSITKKTKIGMFDSLSYRVKKPDVEDVRRLGLRADLYFDRGALINHLQGKQEPLKARQKILESA